MQTELELADLGVLGGEVMEKGLEELKNIALMIDFLCNTYPDLFVKRNYIHPVKGECNLMSIVQKQFSCDYSNIDQVNFNFYDNEIKIKTIYPDTTHVISNFIKDVTVL